MENCFIVFNSLFLRNLHDVLSFEKNRFFSAKITLRKNSRNLKQYRENINLILIFMLIFACYFLSQRPLFLVLGKGP